MKLPTTPAILLLFASALLVKAVDTDFDGLDDSVETNTGIYVDATNTGTDPTNSDSDGDGTGDWYEVTATFTNPVDPNDNPGIPYPLTAHEEPVKVYILSGDLTMLGRGQVHGSGPGTLNTVVNQQNKFPNLVDETGNWATLKDVYVHSYETNNANIRRYLLGPAEAGNTIGPELGFGCVVGWYHEEPVLIIKAANANRALGWDLLPPGSTRFDWTDGFTYPGYGESPERWPLGSVPTPLGWYAGKEYDDYFLDEADMGPREWENSTFYQSKCQVRSGGTVYKARWDHVSTPDSEPGVGGSWNSYWDVYSVYNVTDILDNFALEFPQWADRGFEIAGYAWCHGERDRRMEAHIVKYEENLARLINHLRRYYANRYPGRTSLDAPFVAATLAFGGWDQDVVGPNLLRITNALLAVDGTTGRHPEFAGNVMTVEVRDYWRGRDQSPGNNAFAYLGNAEIYMLVGDALGRAMVGLTISGGQPPVILSAQADPAVLWPPNKKMTEVKVSTVVDGGTGEVKLEIVRVECDDPHSPSDYQILDDHTVALRATRSGKGSGRIYTLHLRAIDELGLASEEATTTVFVPHDQGGQKRR